jgi:heptosyltransferase-1
VVSVAALTVAVDTGLLHVAEALGRPSVGLHGAGPWPLFREYRRMRMLNVQLSCSPCDSRPTCVGYPCMVGITPAMVLDAVRDALASASASPCLAIAS